MQGQHPQPRVQQPLDQQPVRPLDRHELDLQPAAAGTGLAGPSRHARTWPPTAPRPPHQRRARRASPTPNQRQRNFPSVTTSLGQDNSTAPRPRGTVADAHREALKELRPVAASRHLTSAGRGWSALGPGTGKQSWPSPDGGRGNKRMTYGQSATADGYCRIGLDAVATGVTPALTRNRSGLTLERHSPSGTTWAVQGGPATGLLHRGRKEARGFATSPFVAMRAPARRGLAGQKRPSAGQRLAVLSLSGPN